MKYPPQPPRSQKPNSGQPILAVCAHCHHEFYLTNTSHCPNCGKKFVQKTSTAETVWIVLAVVIGIPFLLFGACLVVAVISSIRL